MACMCRQSTPNNTCIYKFCALDQWFSYKSTCLKHMRHAYTCYLGTEYAIMPWSQNANCIYLPGSSVTVVMKCTIVILIRERMHGLVYSSKFSWYKIFVTLNCWKSHGNNTCSRSESRSVCARVHACVGLVALTEQYVATPTVCEEKIFVINVKSQNSRKYFATIVWSYIYAW